MFVALCWTKNTDMNELSTIGALIEENDARHSVVILNEILKRILDIFSALKERNSKERLLSLTVQTARYFTIVFALLNHPSRLIIRNFVFVLTIKSLSHTYAIDCLSIILRSMQNILHLSRIS